MTREEAIELINNSDYCYDLCSAGYLLKNCKLIKRQDYIFHRWYIMATDIYEVEDGYVGVKGVSDLKSEGMDYSDCDKHCVAEEYDPIEIQTITYIPKK